MTIIDDLEAKAKAATPGPWKEIQRCAHADADESCGVTSEQKTAHGHVIGIFQSDAYDECSHPVSRPNAAFIAAANPEAVLKLIAVARAAEAYGRFADESPYGSRGDDALNDALDALKEPSK